MKSIVTLLLISSACFAQHEHKTTEPPADTLKKSIPKEVHVQMGDAHLMIKYYAPAIRGRVIWGGLVPYGEVWVTGAHSATSWEFNKDLVIDGKTITAGKYAIFTIPGKEKWTLILNKNWNQHLSDDYNQEDDVIRVEVTPQIAAHQERLAYSITSKSDTKGLLSIHWEKINVTVPFKTK
ncbi:hypothetical protein WSM22_35300 [Cytophagales bacterium WSM2-2]|nr:hypothetical protein WSM22_35300 [Cytophagales bacterium WSM2-2]